MNDNICPTDLCTGCGACANICPKKCITLDSKGVLGAYVPVIDNPRCINCGICKKICPQNNDFEGHEPFMAYAAYCKDLDDYLSSTSGGASSTIARYFINNGGIVYGAAISDDLQVKHIRIEHTETLHKIKGSKYIQSFISEELLENVKKDLNLGRMTLFIGTPCQIDGLKHYLGKPYSNLVVVCLVCHGVPSWNFFKEHITSMAAGEVQYYSFRDGVGYTLTLTLTLTDGSIVSRAMCDDYYYYGFMKGVLYRESCYNCRYAGSKRCSDLTIGDFWGVGKLTIPKPEHGLSLILVNTAKGEVFFDAIKKDLYYEKRSVEEAISGNKQLRHPSRRNKKRGLLTLLYPYFGFEKSMKLVFGVDMKLYKLRNWILAKI